MAKVPETPADESVTPAAKPASASLVKIVVSRAILAAIFVLPRDPVMLFYPLLFCFIALVMAAIRAARKSPAVRVSLAKAAVYGVAAVIGYAAINADRGDVDELVAALEAYKQRHGAYPDRLDALVPAMVASLPKPGMAGLQYEKREASYRLSYRPSIAGPCSYTPEGSAWECEAR